AAGPRPVVGDARAALAETAPQLHEAVPGNVCFRWARGDEAAVRRAFAGAAHVTRVDLVNNRLIGGAIEPRAALAEPASGKLTLYSSTQVAHHIRRFVAGQLGLSEGSGRVVGPDVRGVFWVTGEARPAADIVAGG